MDVLGGLIRVLVGLLVTFGVGHYAAKWIRNWVRRGYERPDALRDKDDDRRASFVGHIERGIFALLVVAVPASLPGMMTSVVLWTSAKTAVNWIPQVQEDGKGARVKAMASLVATLVSVTAGAAGGLLIRG